MRLLLPLLGALGLTACGGNWSNADLAFVDALPRAADLRAQLPASAAAQPLSGSATRRDGLSVGEPSAAWAQTRKASADFNGLVDLLLGMVDRVRLLPPTTRTADGRTWGPWPDANNPGTEVQVRITRTAEATYGWAIEARQGEGDFFALLTGDFVSAGAARRGRGALTVHVKDFRDRLRVDAELQQLDRIEVGYVLDAFPHRVEMLFTFTPGASSGLSALGYTSRLAEDGSGALRFVFSGPGPEIRELELDARWSVGGAGRALGTVREGLYQGATTTECWGADFAVVHYAESWAGGQVSGSAADCVTVAGL